MVFFAGTVVVGFGIFAVVVEKGVLIVRDVMVVASLEAVIGFLVVVHVVIIMIATVKKAILTYLLLVKTVYNTHVPIFL